MELLPGEVWQVSKRNSQYFRSYLRKTTGGALWAPPSGARVNSHGRVPFRGAPFWSVVNGRHDRSPAEGRVPPFISHITILYSTNIANGNGSDMCHILRPEKGRHVVLIHGTYYTKTPHWCLFTTDVCSLVSQVKLL